jgi:hypothetical protein
MDPQVAQRGRLGSISRDRVAATVSRVGHAATWPHAAERDSLRRVPPRVSRRIEFSGGHSEPRCGNVPLTRTPENCTRGRMRSPNRGLSDCEMLQMRFVVVGITNVLSISSEAANSLKPPRPSD